MELVKKYRELGVFVFSIMFVSFGLGELFQEKGTMIGLAVCGVLFLILILQFTMFKGRFVTQLAVSVLALVVTICFVRCSNANDTTKAELAAFITGSWTSIDEGETYHIEVSDNQFEIYSSDKSELLTGYFYSVSDGDEIALLDEDGTVQLLVKERKANSIVLESEEFSISMTRVMD